MVVGTVALVELLIHVFFHVSKSETWMSETARAVTDVATLALASLTALFFWVFKPLLLAERRALTEKIVNTERDRMQRYLDVAGTMLVVINRDQSIALINRKGCNVLGHEKSDLMGKNWFELAVPEKVRSDVKSVFSRIMDSGPDAKQPEYFEGAVITKNGEERTIAWHTALLKDDQGTIIGALSSGEDITERRRTEEAIKGYAEQYETLKATDLFGYLLVDEKGNILDSNESYCRMTGYTKEELSSLSIPDLEVIDNPEDVARRIRKVIADGKARFESRHRDKEGRVFDVEISLAYFRSQKVFISFIRDITERKQAEEALREKEYLLSESQRLGRIGSWSVDLATDAITWTEETYRLYGVSPGQFTPTAESLIGLLHPEDREAMREHIKALAMGTGAAPDELEFRVILPDGSIRMLRGRGEMILSGTGRPIRLVGTVQDITEQKQAEEKILQSKQDWEDTFNTITDMVTIHDKNFNVIRANKAAEQLLNLPLLGDSSRKCYRLYHGAESPPASCTSCKSLITGQLTVVEMFEPHLNKFIEIRAIPRLDKNDRMVGFIHVVRDITERKKLEEQLFQSQKLAAVGQLAGGVAHDFNNILTAILGDVYILGMKLGDQGPLTPYIEDIRASSEKAAALTRDLLAFSRKQVINPRPLDVNALVQKMQKLMAGMAGEEIHLNIVQTDPDLTVLADSGRLEQVLMNLVANARDSMPRGGTLTISAGRARMDDAYIAEYGFGRVGDYAHLSVADTGTGMDDQTRKRIFEPFFTTKELGKGTGLGLSIAYGIIKQHNGFIDCFSAPGAGTVFNIYLPLALDERGAEERPGAPARGKECILLADDDAMVRKTTKEVIEESGYRVIDASDGEDAVRKFNENRNDIQLLIMDVLMPGKSGMEAYEEIKAMKPEVKALFLSGYSDEIIHRKDVLDESLNFLTKPSSPVMLLTRIRELLDR